MSRGQIDGGEDKGITVREIIGILVEVVLEAVASRPQDIVIRTVLVGGTNVLGTRRKKSRDNVLTCPIITRMRDADDDDTLESVKGRIDIIFEIVEQVNKILTGRP